MPNIQHKLSIREEDNPVYYSLMGGYNELATRYNTIQKSLQSIKMNGLILKKPKNQLDSIEPEITKLVTDYLKWRYDTDNFLLKPNLILTDATDSGIAFLHYMENLRAASQRMEGMISIVEENYKFISSHRSNAINFRIAIISFALTFLGLILTVYALLK